MPDSVNLGTVHVSLEMRLQKFRDGIRDGKRELASFESSLNKFGDNMQRVGQKMSLAVTAPLVLLGKQAIKTAADMEAMEKGMAKLMGSAESARKEIAQLREVAKLPGLGFEDAVRGSLRLQGMGTSAEQARKILLAFGNAVATMGGGMAELDGVTRALGQTLAKGKISMEEVLQLAERQIPVFQAMKSIWGTADTEALQKMGVTAAEFVTKLTEFFGAQERVADSSKNKIENLGQAWDNFLSKIGDTLLKGGLTNAMDGFIKKLDSAVTWFGNLDQAQQTAFTNIALALAASGPVMLAIGGLAKGIAGVSAGLTLLARHPLLAALLAGGAATAFAAGPGGDAIQSGMNKWLDNLFQSIGLKKKEPPLPTVGPFAPRPEMLRPLGQVMTPDAQGGFNLSDFIPGLKPRPGTKTTPGKKPVVVDPEAAKRARELLSANLDLLAELGGEEASIMRQAQRMRNQGLRPDLVQRWIAQQLAPILKKRNEIMMGNVLRQGKEEAHSLPRIGPAIPNLGAFARDFGLRPGLPDVSGMLQAQQFAAFLQNRPANVTPQGGLSIFSAAALGAGTDAFAKKFAPGEGLRTRDIEMKAEPVLKQLSFNLGQEFGNNFAMEMGRAFGDMFAKVFGDGNPLSRALGRTLSRLVDDVMYTLAQRAFGNKLMLSIFGGAGGLAGTGAGLGAAGAGIAGGAAGAAGAKAGSMFGAAFAAKAAIAIAGVFAVGAGLNALLGGRGRFNVNTIGEKLFPAAPALGSAYAAGGTHFGPPINIYMSGFRLNNDMDVRRTAETLAFHTREKMRSR